MNQLTSWHCSLCENPNPRPTIACVTFHSLIQPWKKRKLCQSLGCDVCTPLLHLAPEKRRRTQTPYETKEWNSAAFRPTYTSPTMDQLNFITRIRNGKFQISELTATLHKNPELQEPQQRYSANDSHLDQQPSVCTVAPTLTVTPRTMTATPRLRWPSSSYSPQDSDHQTTSSTLK